MKRLALSLALALFCCGLNAQDQALVFTRTPMDPVSASLAGADATLSENISWSAFGNAAAMAFHEGSMDASLSYTMWAPASLRTDRFGIGAAYHSKGLFSFALGGSYGKGPSYEVINDDGAHAGMLDTSDMLLAAGAAVRFSDALSLGANLLYASESIYVDGGLSGILADVSLFFRTGGLRLSGGISHVGPQVADKDARGYSTPASARFAAGYALGLSEGHAIDFLGNADVYFNGGVGASAALQYSLRGMLFLRGGFHYGDKNSPLPSCLTLGAGAKVGGIRIDAAWITANKVIGNTFSFSLGYGF